MLDSAAEDEALLDFWPQSSRLTTALGENRAEPRQYTLPGIKYEFQCESIPDQAMSNISRISNTTENLVILEALKNLIKDGHFEITLWKSSEVLTKRGHGMGTLGISRKISTFVYKFWSLRFQMMWAMKKYLEIADEIAPFEELDAPDLFYEYVKEAGRKGSMVPFAIRMIHAEILRMTPFPWKSIERIQRLEENIEKIINEMSSASNTKGFELWKRRQQAVLTLKLRTLHHLEEYANAVQVGRQMVENSKSNEEKAEILRGIVRIAMTVGDEKTLESALSETAPLSQKHLLLHKAYRAIFHGSFAHAIDYLQKAVDGGDTSPQVINTLAVCHLYNGAPSIGVQKLLETQGGVSETMKTNVISLSEVSYSAKDKAALLARIH
ncbi:unnamed protein product, partial [Mesorhabditis belari]|uniref:Uncharacterized protein n=1 Tax=Mesorhabditis belari TaxID=2138241 RepID=A0AAF3EQE1_9BILA